MKCVTWIVLVGSLASFTPVCHACPGQGGGGTSTGGTVSAGAGLSSGLSTGFATSSSLTSPAIQQAMLQQRAYQQALQQQALQLQTLQQQYLQQQATQQNIQLAELKHQERERRIALRKERTATKLANQEATRLHNLARRSQPDTQIASSQ